MTEPNDPRNEMPDDNAPTTDDAATGAPVDDATLDLLLSGEPIGADAPTEAHEVAALLAALNAPAAPEELAGLDSALAAFTAARGASTGAPAVIDLRAIRKSTVLFAGVAAALVLAVGATAAYASVLPAGAQAWAHRWIHAPAAPAGSHPGGGHGNNGPGGEPALDNPGQIAPSGTTPNPRSTADPTGGTTGSTTGGTPAATGAGQGSSPGATSTTVGSGHGKASPNANANPRSTAKATGKPTSKAKGKATPNANANPRSTAKATGKPTSKPTKKNATG